MERRAPDDTRDRIDRHLASTALNTRTAKVVPLTGDASDRRDFRVLLRDEPAQVLAVHPGPIDFAALPFVNVAKLLAEMPTWELQFFTKHFLEAYRGAQITPAAREALAAEYAAIVEELASEPRVLCHRDYHSRNLMLHEGNLYIIDFQDARLGPDTYDLVSLLRDSYVDFTEAQIEELIAFFLAMRGHTGQSDSAADRQEFRRRFDLMALQRNLKALGTFGFQTTSRGNPVYIQYIPRTLSYVRGNLAKHPRFAALRTLLGTH